MPIDPFHAPVPHLLEVAQVAHRLSVSPEFVRELLRKKKLPAVRLGKRWRIDLRDLEAWIDAQRVPLETPVPGQHRGRDGPRPLPDARNA